MAWLAQNWFWVLIFVMFIGMHLFGHGGHMGGGCGHRGHKHPDKDKDNQGKDNQNNNKNKDQPSSGHQH